MNEDEEVYDTPLTLLEMYPAPWLIRGIFNYRDFKRRSNLNICAQRVDALEVAMRFPKRRIAEATKQLEFLNANLHERVRDFIARHHPTLKANVKTHDDVSTFLSTAPLSMKKELDYITREDASRAKFDRARVKASKRLEKLEKAVEMNMDNIEALAMKYEYLDVLADATEPIDGIAIEENMQKLADIQMNLMNPSAEPVSDFEERFAELASPNLDTNSRLAEAIADALFPEKMVSDPVPARLVRPITTRVIPVGPIGVSGGLSADLFP